MTVSLNLYDGHEEDSNDLNGSETKEITLIVEGIQEVNFQQTHWLFYFVDDAAREKAKQLTGWHEDPSSPNGASSPSRKCLIANVHWGFPGCLNNADMENQVRYFVCSSCDKKHLYFRWELIGQ